MGPMTIQDVQDRVREGWTNATYSPEFNASGVVHKDLAHALLHVQKAAGKLAAIVDDLDHGKEPSDDPGKYIADLVICAARAANCSGLSLNGIVGLRLAVKVPVDSQDATRIR